MVDQEEPVVDVLDTRHLHEGAFVFMSAAPVDIALATANDQASLMNEINSLVLQVNSSRGTLGYTKAASIAAVIKEKRRAGRFEFQRSLRTAGCAGLALYPAAQPSNTPIFLDRWPFHEKSLSFSPFSAFRRSNSS